MDFDIVNFQNAGEFICEFKATETIAFFLNVNRYISTTRTKGTSCEVWSVALYLDVELNLRKH